VMYEGTGDYANSSLRKVDYKTGRVLSILSLGGGEYFGEGITIYKDKSFDFVIKTPPAPVLLLEASKKKKGSAEPNRVKVGSVTWDQVKEIAETKMTDLNAFKIESAMRQVAGTARSMGIKVTGTAPWKS